MFFTASSKSVGFTKDTDLARLDRRSERSRLMVTSRLFGHDRHGREGKSSQEP